MAAVGAKLRKGRVEVIAAIVAETEFRIWRTFEAKVVAEFDDDPFTAACDGDCTAGFVTADADERAGGNYTIGRLQSSRW